ncbi:MAG TPA: hypothetical protein VME17_01365 [Bryobacteraceae bacterium]|nr:hypothetical protein [Bryobacteraceae bacterium]
MGFLTTLGALATLNDAGHQAWLAWNGVIPCLSAHIEAVERADTEEQRHALLVNALHQRLQRRKSEHATEIEQAKKEMERAKTALKKKSEEIRARKLDRATREHEVKALRADLESKEAAFKKALLEGAADPSVALGKNLTVPGMELIAYIAAACEQARLADRRWIDLAASYGLADPASPEDRILTSPWALISGSGHQDFLSSIESLMLECGAEHLRQALFGPWSPRDEKYSLRLDSADDRRYALMDRDPTDGDNKPRTLWGANRLAFEALRFFPSVPIRRGMGVRAWRAGNGNWLENCEVRWPLWEPPSQASSVHSVLGLRELWLDDLTARQRLKYLGVHTIMESRRIAAVKGKYYNLTPAAPVWVS